MWQEKKTKKINIDINGDFPAYDCTQEQNVSPRLTMQNGLGKIVAIQKFCFHGNVTSQFFSLLQLR